MKCFSLSFNIYKVLLVLALVTLTKVILVLVVVKLLNTSV